MTARLLRWTLACALGLVAIWAMVQLSRGLAPALSWVGVLLASGAPLVGLLTHRGPQRPPLAWTAACGLGVAITMAVSYRYGEAAGTAHVWAGCALIAWFAWVRWRPDATA
jgi:hypothetical protein